MRTIRIKVSEDMYNAMRTRMKMLYFDSISEYVRALIRGDLVSSGVVEPTHNRNKYGNNQM